VRNSPKPSKNGSMGHNEGEALFGPLETINEGSGHTSPGGALVALVSLSCCVSCSHLLHVLSHCGNLVMAGARRQFRRAKPCTVV